MPTGIQVWALLALLAAGCTEAVEQRTLADFNEVGHADVGPVHLHVDPGTVQQVDPETGAVQIRVNAPVFEISLSSTAADRQELRLELINLAPDTVVDPPLELETLEHNRLILVVPVAAGETSSLSFRRAGGERPRVLRFAWVGDVQGGLEGFRPIRDAINANPTLEFTVFAGDITGHGGPEAISEFIGEADGLEQPWYALLGNHELIGGSAEDFQQLVGRIDYSFDYCGVRFVLLDAAAGTLDELVYDFLERVLAPAEPRLRVVGMHIPPMDPDGVRDGGFASRAEGARVMSLLGRGGVDLLLAGHIHTYDVSSFAGVQCVISGDGGVGNAQRLDDTGHHFLAVELDPASEQVSFEKITP